MEAGEYGITRGTWFFARRPEVVAVAGLLWLSRCVFDEAGFFFNFDHEYTTDGCERPRQHSVDSQPICPPRTRVHLSPPGVPFSVLTPDKFGVIS